MKRAMRVTAAAVALVFTTSCAAIIHPERKGNNAPPIDTVPLVVDILLFLPGILPGVIALVVDFGTGAIYMNRNGSQAPLLGKNGRKLVRQSRKGKLAVRIVDDSGMLLEEHKLTVEAPDKRGEPVALVLPDLTAERWTGQNVHLEIVGEGGEPIVLPAQ